MPENNQMQTPEPQPQAQPPQPQYSTGPVPGSEKKLVAGLLGILLGGLGIHKFYLGYVNEGIIQIILTFFCGIGQIIGLIEGVIYLTKPDQEFVDTYVNNKRGWF